MPFLRKMTLLMLITALTAAPVLAQDDGHSDDTDHAAQPSIAHILEESAHAAEAPEFTILLEAAEEAGIVEVLADNGPFTVFAPTDAAFTRLLQDLNIEAEVLFNDYEFLLEVLLYHVVPGTFEHGRVVALDGAAVATLLPGATLSIAAEGAVTVDSVPVVATDVMASNGVVHVIDGVLIPSEGEGELDTLLTVLPETSLAAVVTARAEDNDATVRQFANLLRAAQSAELVEALAEGGPFTIFAPTDAAFAAYLDANGLTLADLDANGDALAEILQYHMVPAALLSRDVLHLENAFVGTLLPGQALHIVVEGGDEVTVSVNGAALDLTLVDILGENGVIHAIDAVLLPTAALGTVE